LIFDEVTDKNKLAPFYGPLYIIMVLRNYITVTLCVACFVACLILITLCFCCRC